MKYFEKNAELAREAQTDAVDRSLARARAVYKQHAIDTGFTELLQKIEALPMLPMLTKLQEEM